MPEPKFEEKIEEKPEPASRAKKERVETYKPKYASKKVAVQMMLEARSEFPESFREILRKKEAKQKLSPEEWSELDLITEKWWQERFGISFSKRFSGLTESQRLFVRRSPTGDLPKIDALVARKQIFVKKLYEELSRLDAGEAVESFGDEKRRIVYYEEQESKFFTLDNGNRKYLTIQDILSDYAWGISYVPDGEMVEPEYRLLAKKILVNETRREIETTYNEELRLRTQYVGDINRIDTEFEDNWRNGYSRPAGVVSEVMAREILSRISGSKESQIVVLRADFVEDHLYKYDFKVRTKRSVRGVGIGEDEEINRRIKKIGIQFTINAFSKEKKETLILKAKKQYASELPVDDIILVKIPTYEFSNAYTRWLKKGKPSGGPEQFLSKELKIELLEAVTQGLV